MAGTLEARALRGPQDRAAEVRAAAIERGRRAVAGAYQQSFASVRRGERARLARRERVATREHDLERRLTTIDGTTRRPLAAEREHRRGAGGTEKASPVETVLV